MTKAWDQLLLAQHHDAWICARSGPGRRNWAWQVGAETWAAEEICDALNAERLEMMGRDGDGAPAALVEEARWIRVFNTLGTGRADIAEAMLTMDPRTRGVRVFDAAGLEVPAQVVMTRKYMGDESINAGRVLFEAKAPSMGYATYRWEPVMEPVATQPEGARVILAEDGTEARIETDLYSIALDGKRGGAITSLFAKSLGKEFVDLSHDRLFNEYRGYFIEEKQWFSSADSLVRFVVVESGPVRVKLQMAGAIGGHPFSCTIAASQGQRRIDFHFAMGFKKETFIGDEVHLKPEERRAQRRKGHHDGRYKLQAFFPALLKASTLQKNAAYDVCKSRLGDTYFQSWDEIKHNIILNWVDVTDEAQGMGLGLLSDHTTAYTHGSDHPLALVLGWGGEGGSWWGMCALRDPQEAAYALVPHAGSWDAAGLSEECARWSEPLLAQRMPSEPGPVLTRSLIKVEGKGIEIPTVLADGADLLVRLFSAEGDGSPFTVTLAAKAHKVQLAELDGRPIRELERVAGRDGETTLSLAMPRFGLRTVRFCGVV